MLEKLYKGRSWIDGTEQGWLFLLCDSNFGTLKIDVFQVTSGRQKVSGQERFYHKNSRFHTKIFHQGKFAKIQTLHRTTETVRLPLSIYKYLLNSQYLKSSMQLNFENPPRHSFPTKNSGLGANLRKLFVFFGTTYQII